MGESLNRIINKQNIPFTYSFIHSFIRLAKQVTFVRSRQDLSGCYGRSVFGFYKFKVYFSWGHSHWQWVIIAALPALHTFGAL